MSKWFKIAALAIAAVAVVVLMYAVLTPDEPADSTDHMGMWGRATYSTRNVGLIAVSVIVIVSSIMFAAFWNKYEPLPPSIAATQMSLQAATNQAKAETAVLPALVKANDADVAAAHNYLVLRLLSGDERTMYKALMDSGGEALQKDLILRTKMSNAKVSRVLDRLVEKDIVVKERYGATNKVKIRLDR